MIVNIFICYKIELFLFDSQIRIIHDPVQIADNRIEQFIPVTEFRRSAAAGNIEHRFFRRIQEVVDIAHPAHAV